ncbi:MAG: DUF6708 domain-containing protein, partial [Massilia sp.]
GITLGLLKKTHTHAIEYTGIPNDVRGLMMFSALITTSISIYGGHMMLGDLLHLPFRLWDDGIFVVFACMFILFGIYFGFKFSRMELFRPADEPVIFDRKHRKVYRIFHEVHPGIQGAFKPWPIRAAEYEWDLIDVEHNAKMVTNGSTTSRYHNLIFIVRRSADDPTIIDSFNIGNGMVLGEATVPAVWEHIRRFMEADGPHVPPGETLNDAPAPRSLWENLSAIGPFGPNYRLWWKELTGLMMIVHVMFPFFVPMYAGMGICSWLSNLTSIAIRWPQEVIDAVGPDSALPGKRNTLAPKHPIK